MTLKTGLRKPGNIGVVATTIVANGNLLHTMPTRAIAGPRTARITKIMCYVPPAVGANVTLQFGTRDRTVGAAFVPLLPIFVAINALDNEWLETEIPNIEWISNESAGAAGRTGDIYVLADAATATIQIEVEEYGC